MNHDPVMCCPFLSMFDCSIDIVPIPCDIISLTWKLPWHTCIVYIVYIYTYILTTLGNNQKLNFPSSTRQPCHLSICTESETSRLVYLWLPAFTTSTSSFPGFRRWLMVANVSLVSGVDIKGWWSLKNVGTRFQLSKSLRSGVVLSRSMLAESRGKKGG